MDVIEESIKGCSSRGGMPKIFVNPQNLNVVVGDVDLSYSGLGPKVEIKRTYNADDPRDSIFGRSWTFNYDVTLSEVPGGIYVRRGSGKIHLFTGAGIGPYYPPKGVYDELVKKADGTYSLWIKKDRVTQNFDTNGKLVNIVDQNGNAITFQNEWVNPPLIWGSNGSGNGQFNYPHSLAVDQSGYVYVADANNHRIQKFDSQGNYVTQWGSYGSGDGQFSYPYGVAVDQSGYVYVTEVGNNRVQKFDSSGNFITKWGSYGSENGQFIDPRSVAVDQSGYVYVGEYANSRVQKFTNDGTFVLKWGS